MINKTFWGFIGYNIIFFPLNEVNLRKWNLLKLHKLVDNIIHDPIKWPSV